MSDGVFEALEKQLRSAAHARERAAVTGQLLAAAGDRVRTGQQAPESSVRALGREDVEAWLSVVDANAIRAELNRAVEAAFEALLADSAEEAREFRTWAIEALHGRDDLESSLVGLASWEKLGGALGEAGQRVRERLNQELHKVDAQGPSLARRLVGLNDARRTARDRLTAEHRARAWWYAARAECDELAGMLKSADAPAAAHCESCARDRENAKLAERPPGGCVSEDELWNLDEGTMPPARRRLIEKHARHCGECSLALSAVAVPLFDEQVQSPELARVGGGAPEVLVTRAEFKVLLFRGPKARLVVSPNEGQQLAAAALQGGAIIGKLDAVVSSAGLELQLPMSHSRARLTVQLPGGRSVELDVEV